MRKSVLSLCDRTGNMVKPWRDAGYQCVCVDLRPMIESDGIERVCADVRNYLPPMRTYAAAFAFPPCTDMAVSGARWFEDKGLEALHEALGIVIACKRICEWAECPWMIEHPVSTLSTYWREPNHTFDPCDYGLFLDPPGDAYTKRTCLWTGGGFVMPAAGRVEPVEGSRMHRLPPSEDRADIRSATPMGFARAVFLANHKPQSLPSKEDAA